MGKGNPSTLQAIWFLLAAGLVFVGTEFELPVATEVGLACLGVFMVAVGIENIAKRLGVFRIDGWTQAKVVLAYRGLAEILWGFMLICLGLVMAGFATMNWFGPAAVGSFWSGVLNTTTGLGAILAGVGLMMLLNGLIRALAGGGTVDPQRLGGLPYLLDRLAGVVMFLLGAGIASTGLLVLVAPGVAAAAVERMRMLVLGS